MDILLDVQVLPGVPRCPVGPWEPDAADAGGRRAVSARQWLAPHDHARAHRLIEERFSELFAPNPEGFRPLWRQEAREMLITWETDQRRG